MIAANTNQNTVQDGLISTNTTNIGLIDTRVTTLETNDPIQDGLITALDGRVTTNETAINTQDSRLTALENAGGATPIEQQVVTYEPAANLNSPGTGQILIWPVMNTIPLMTMGTNNFIEYVPATGEFNFLITG